SGGGTQAIPPWPAATRFLAMAVPMRPRPTNPMSPCALPPPLARGSRCSGAASVVVAEARRGGPDSAFNMRLLIGCTRAPLLTRRMFQKGFKRSCPRLPDFMSACRLTSGVSSDHGPDTDGLWPQGWNDGDRTGKTCSSDPSWPKTLRSVLQFPSLGQC